MPLTSVKKTNVNLEDENQTARGKKQVFDTPRRALGDMKNTATPNRSFLKGPTAVQKPGLQFVSSNLGSVEARARHSRISNPPISTSVNSNTNDDIIEECNLHEDPRIEKGLFRMEDSIILSDPENEAEYFKKLVSTECYANDHDIDDDEPIEMCGSDDEVFDFRHVMNDVEANAVLTDDFPSFQYERPNESDLDKVKKYTLQEMEDLFDSFSDVLIL